MSDKISQKPPAPVRTGKQTYQELGASASKSGLHEALNRAGVADDSGLFIKLNADLAGDPKYRSFLHCDGAGTKTIVAYLLFRETGDARFFRGLAQDAFVMNLDDALCAGRPESLMIANAIARNSKLIPDTVLGEIIARYRELTEWVLGLGLPIELSGGETADCGDTVRTLVVDAVLAGRIQTNNLIDCAQIVPGDIIVGIASGGQTTYETQPNSGIGSNGLTLARHALLKHDYATRFPEILDPQLDPQIAYRGPFALNDKPQPLGMTVGEALLSPTRSYAPLLLPLFDTLKDALHGLIHVTGGGLTKVLRFGSGNLYLKNNPFPTPPIFSLIQQHGGVSWREMYQVFNMGHRLELYLPQDALPVVQKVAKDLQLDARQIGIVEKLKGKDARQNQVRIEGPNGVFEYGL